MRRWQFPVCVIVFKGVEDVDSRAAVIMEASMQSAWSVSGSFDDYFVIFNMFSRLGGDTKATLLSHPFLEPSDLHVDGRIRTCEYMSQVSPGMIILGNTKLSKFSFFFKTALLRYNSHTIKFILPKCTIRCFYYIYKYV